jgi:hypothetical protein
MDTTVTARCDGIIALIEECLAEFESTTPLRLVRGSGGRVAPQDRSAPTLQVRPGSQRRPALQIVQA